MGVRIREVWTLVFSKGSPEPFEVYQEIWNDFYESTCQKSKGKGQIELLDYPVPQVKEGYVLLRIEAAGICGSDLKIYNDDHPYFPPVVLGHEFSGTVVEESVRGSGLEEGRPRRL